MKKVTPLLLSSVFLSISVLALEPQNPATLCDRFIAPETKSLCEKKITKMSPDWYLASVCDKQFEDSEFWKCLELSQSKNFSPVALESCNADGVSDEKRLSCLKNLATQNSFQSGAVLQRTPASQRKKHP
jgi:hypothetical protein